MKKIFICLFAAFMLLTALTGSVSVSADGVTGSYTYNYWGESVPAPDAYKYSDISKFEESAFGSIADAVDMFVFGGEIYLLDSGNNRIVVTDSELNTVREIKLQYENGIADARGLFVNDNGDIYIALYEQKTILICNKDGSFKKAIGQPQSDLIPEDFIYSPLKVLVNRYGYICVVAEGSYYGVILMNESGDFEGFYASNRVQASVLDGIGNFLKSIFTQAQKDRLKRSLPTEYSSIAMDSEKFIYVTSATAADKTSVIKKLSPSGNGILNNPQGGIYGDVETAVVNGAVVSSVFGDICVDDKGFINALDIQRGKIFQYNQDSNMVTVFGATGDRHGTFSNPVAVECIGDNIYVLDRKKNQIMKFVPTEYGFMLREAMVKYSKGLYDESRELWQTIGTKNSNLELVYDGLGKAALGEENYKTAMGYFKLSQNRKDYATALEAERGNWITQNFAMIFIIIAALLGLAWFALSRGIKKEKSYNERAKESKYCSPIYTAMHPFKGFEQIKLHKKGSMKYSVIILVIVFAVKMLALQFDGFLYNYPRSNDINILFEVAQVFVLFVVWVLCNWSVSTLMDGEGFGKEIWIVSAYALLPYAVINAVGIVLSNGLVYEEAAFLNGLYTVAIIWAAICMIIGLMQIHQFSFKKTILLVVLTIVGIFFVLFIGFLLYSMIGQLAEFVKNIIKEVRYRT